MQMSKLESSRQTAERWVWRDSESKKIHMSAPNLPWWLVIDGDESLAKGLTECLAAHIDLVGSVPPESGESGSRGEVVAEWLVELRGTTLCLFHDTSKMTYVHVGLNSYEHHPAIAVKMWLKGVIDAERADSAKAERESCLKDVTGYSTPKPDGGEYFTGYSKGFIDCRTDITKRIERRSQPEWLKRNLSL
jgi:hypothetical protein